MPINTRGARCYTDRGEVEGLHFDAPSSLDEPERMSTDCMVAICDGLPDAPCGETFGDGEYDERHFQDPGNVAQTLAEEDWEVCDDGSVRCAQCRDGVEVPGE